MDIIHKTIEDFAAGFSSPLDSLRQAISSYTQEHTSEPHMLSGQVQGKFLEMVSRMIQPRRILEIGTFTGFSALCLAEGLTVDGQLHTLELRPETAAVAQDFFNQSPLGAKIKLHVGVASDIIPTLNETWDLVFIDADKVSYIEYFDLIIGQVTQNGFILADNIFFHGEVFTAQPTNKSATAIKTFNDYIKERTDIDKLVVTIRDGLYLLRKL